MLCELLASWARLRFPDDVAPVFIVVENDQTETSAALVADARSKFEHGGLSYHLEPEIGIPFARNAAVKAALNYNADLIAFADDDETVAEDWFIKLYETYCITGAQLVGGPVRASFKATPRSWRERIVLKGIVSRYDRVERKALDRFRQGNTDRLAILTNNWLADASLFTKYELGFDCSLRFTGGSDTKFFRDAVARGVKTGWSPDAIVFETIPADRISLNYQYQRGKEQSKTSIRAKIAAGGRGKVLPVMAISVALRSASVVLLIAAAPFTGGRTIVQCVRTCGWIVGRLAGYSGRQSNLYRITTGE